MEVKQICVLQEIRVDDFKSLIKMLYSLGVP